MTNGELIQDLSKFPQSAEIAVMPPGGDEVIYPNGVFFSKKDDEIIIFRVPCGQD